MNSSKFVLLWAVLISFICLVPHGNAGETVSVKEAKAILKFEQNKDPDHVITWKGFTDNYSVSNNRVEVADIEAFVKYAPRDMEKVRAQLMEKTGFLGLKIRSDYSDVLTSEDPTVSEGKDAATDLTGASFSYARDFKADSDSWVAKGAALFPFIGRNIVEPHDGDPPRLSTYGLVPSISFDRETDEADESKNVDSLIFRAGLYAKFVSGQMIRSQTLRLFGTYGTDFHFESQTPALEFEYEPVIFINRYLGTGSTHSLYERQIDGKATTTLAYQLRAYLHGEYGRVTDNGDNKSVPEDNFFRLGPRLEFKLDPFFSDRFAVTTSYEYLGDLAGTTLHNHYFKVSGEYRFTTAKDQEKNPLVPIMSLKVSFENGGIDLTKEQVRTFFVGLGVTL